MGGDEIVGVLIVAAAIGVLLGLIAWSRWIVERIHRRRLGSYRQIAKDMKNG